MKLKKYNTEIKIESVSDKDYPIVISYHYGRGMSPWQLTIDEAEELFRELEAAINKVRAHTL